MDCQHQKTESFYRYSFFYFLRVVQIIKAKRKLSRMRLQARRYHSITGPISVQSICTSTRGSCDGGMVAYIAAWSTMRDAKGDHNREGRRLRTLHFAGLVKSLRAIARHFAKAAPTRDVVTLGNE